MENNDSLDSLISGNLNSAANQEGVITPTQNSNPPKLKKIKRIKVKPHMVAPEVPQKLSPENTEVADDLVANIEQQQAATAENIDANLDEILASTNPQDSGVGTDLVKYNNSQDVSSEYAQSLYDDDRLPPDFDYETEGDGYGNYVDTSMYIKKNVFYLSTLACLFVGLFLGKMFFSSQVIEHHGLEGVVTNPDVPQGRPRCGLTDNSQACILYIMNWYRQELNGRDFYKLAAQLTGREEYMIDTDNLRYSNVKIKAGQIAQLNIPALK